MSDLLARFIGVAGLIGGMAILWVAFKSGFWPLIFLGMAVLVAMGYDGKGSS